MKAAIFKHKGDIEIQETEKPEIIEAKDAIVKITLTTICGTDLHMYHGLEPSLKDNIPGHEFVGDIILSLNDFPDPL